ncbi:MAG: hypothetical protein ACUVWX_01165 [Kiritimatiellia bacterium]
MKAQQGYRVEFAVSGQTDVTVTVENERNQILRHLAAGRLGPNTPAPLKSNSLSQELFWDGRDDKGQPVDVRGTKIRVQVGLQPRLERIVGWNGNTLGSPVVGLVVSDSGEVYVLMADGHGRSTLRVLDRDGRYARTIMPYPANTPKDRAEPVGQIEFTPDPQRPDVKQRLPIVFNSHGGNLYPLTSGMRMQNMAWHPKGFLIVASAVGNWANHRPPRYLLAFHPAGGAPEGIGFVGPQIRGLADRGIGFMGGAGEGSARWFDHLAVSPDGEWIYLVQAGYSSAFKLSHCVHRVHWADHKEGPPPMGSRYTDPGPDELGAPFFGELGRSGSDDAHLNDPQGVATDRDGNVYVCDRGNNRVLKITPEGKLVGRLAVDDPEQIAIHPQSGELYVLSQKPTERGKPRPPAILRKFGAWKGIEAPTELTSVSSTISLMALDPSAPSKLWAVTSDGLVAIVGQGDQLAVGKPINNHDGVKFPGFVTPDPERQRIIYREMLTGQNPIRLIDLKTGQRRPFLPGTDAALDRHGNIYVTGGYGSHGIFRYDPAGNPLPFSATGSNKLETGPWASYGPNIGLRGHCVAPNGDIYFLRSNKWAGGIVNRVDVFGPDGKLKKANFIDGLQAGDCGIGVDAAGNVYVGINAKAKGSPLPTAFQGKVPAQAWNWWRFDREGKRDPPWCYPYQNPYLSHYGSVFKFGPTGGMIYGFSSKPKEGPEPELADINKAPAGAVPVVSGYLKHEGRVVGALWYYHGVGPIPASDFGWGDPGCICWNSRLAVDPYGRVFGPDVFRFSVVVLDANGNEISRIGTYGNEDSAGPGSRVPEPEIAFAWPAYVAVADGMVYVSDPGNRRIVMIRLGAELEAVCALEQEE